MKGKIFPCDKEDFNPCGPAHPECRDSEGAPRCKFCPIIAARINPFRSTGLGAFGQSVWGAFWKRVEQECAEQEKKLLYYDPNPAGLEEDEEDEICDYTGEECIGNKLFCEECSVFVSTQNDTSDWVCRVCGCTNLTPCPGGCAWVIKISVAGVWRHRKMASKMFPFITCTWNPLGGACQYSCRYCWARRLIEQNQMAKYQGEAHLVGGELEKEFKAGDFVFVQDMTDLFAPWVSKVDILVVLDVIRNTPEAKFLLLTKNPRRYLEFAEVLPANAVLGATIETDFYLSSGISYAPSPGSRLDAMAMLADTVENKLFFSVEPILYFTSHFVNALTCRRWRLFGVAVGYDNYECKLSEPSLEKTKQLIGLLEKAGVKVFVKSLREAWKA